MAQRQRSGRLAALTGAGAIVVAVILLLALGGDSTDDATVPKGAGAQKLTLMLDYFPNADHAGIYAAQAGGHFRDEKLDVKVRTPSDPSVPLKLLAAGKADLAVSYEPEVLRARDKGLPVVAVASLVRVPLTSIISLPKSRIDSAADLGGKTVGTAGLDYQQAYLNAILRHNLVPGGTVKVRNVGFDLVPALVSGKVDAVLGAFWNYEGVQLRQRGLNPRVIRIEQTGVPTYSELVIAASEKTIEDHPGRIRQFLKALAAGTKDLSENPGSGTRALLKANKDLDPQLQRASVKATLPYFLPPKGQPYGYLDPGEWLRFHAFMQNNMLLKLASPEAAFTNDFLPEGGQ
jgi:putative hydroxymethylpyrimidine transport system substrate-binding protein